MKKLKIFVPQKRHTKGKINEKFIEYKETKNDGCYKDLIEKIIKD